MIPVVYSAPNQGVVSGFDKLPAEEKVASFWNDETVKPVRKEIKDHYIADQHQLCCYCAHEYPTNHNAVWDGEHVIPRAKAARFMFEPRNLAASCKDCNGAKGDREVRVNPTLVKFPDKSQHYLIAHPHFDVYGQHIIWIDELVAPRSPKGEKLIDMCNLSRFAYKTIGEDTTPIPQSVAKIVGKFMDPQISEAETDMYMAAFSAYTKSKAQKD